MEGGHRAGAQPFDELGVGLDRRSRRKFAAAIGIERLLRDDLARYAEADHGARVEFGLQVVRPDSGRRRRIGRAQGDLAPAFRAQPVDAQREAVTCLERIAPERIGKVQVSSASTASAG
jgi:hypothetical protein